MIPEFGGTCEWIAGRGWSQQFLMEQIAQKNKAPHMPTIRNKSGKNISGCKWD